MTLPAGVSLAALNGPGGQMWVPTGEQLQQQLHQMVGSRNALSLIVSESVSVSCTNVALYTSAPVRLQNYC